MPPSPSRSSRFRFKSTVQIPDPGIKSSKARSDHSDSSHPSEYTPRQHHRRRHHHRRSHHRRHRSRSRSPKPTTPPLSPDAAFRESLFDALADDEGAAYWEGVYGQPIHNYSRYKASASASSPSSPTAAGASSSPPVLERMTDDEYAAYVRARMWEKSHAYVAEERARREEARERAREERREEEQARRERREGHWRRGDQGGGSGGKERAAWEGSLEGAMRRREERTGGGKEAWKRRWQEYLSAWETLMSSERGEKGSKTEEGKRQVKEEETPKRSGNEVQESNNRPPIPWPTPSHRLKDVSSDAVSDFFRRGVEAAVTTSTAAGADASSPQQRLLTMLKLERVRWHPDKMQQRLGGSRGGLSEREWKGVTAVFQIVDDLWRKLQEDGQDPG